MAEHSSVTQAPQDPAKKAVTVYGSTVAGDDPEAREDTGEYNDAELLQEAREFLDYVETAEADNRTRAAEMLRFIYKRFAQWPDKIYRDRTNENRPCLEINQLPQFINQILNDQRQNRPAIKIRPTSGDATVEVAEIYQDLIRHIEQDSNAAGAVDTAFRYCVAGNIGYWRFTTEYESETSFHQKICFKPIPNPFCVYYDPDCKEPDGSDCEKVLITEDINKDEFARRYPDADPIDWQSTDPTLTSWINGDAIKIADYLHVVKSMDTLYQMQNGDVHFESEKPDDWPEEMAWPPSEEWYVNKRDVDRRSVRWEVINGIQVLERHEWAGKYIPVVPVYGDETNIEGDVIRKGAADNAVDSQQMYNFLVTSAAEAAANQPKAPFLVTQEQIAGHEREFGDANIKNDPYLTYNKYSESGQEAGYGPPARQAPDVDVSGTLNQAAIFQQNLRATIGIQDPLSNMNVQDQSGRAILAKERVSNTGTFHFQDNLSRAICFGGQILVDLIPHIYDTERTLQLLREDGTQYTKTVNQQQPPIMPAGTGPMGMPMGGLQPNGQPPMAPPAPPPLRDLTVGEYDVVVESGPSYSTKRVEFANQVLELAQSNPQFWGVAGDIIVKNLDMPNAQAIADRLEVMLPPQIQMLKNNPDADPQVVALQNAMQQQGQQAQAGMQHLQQQLQEMSQQNQKLQSQLYTAAATAAMDKAKAARVTTDAQVDLQTQIMQSDDVKLHAKIDMEQLRADIRKQEQDHALQVIDRILAAIKLQQTQAQPIGPEINQERAFIPGGNGAAQP
jgi:hypothetical protein